MNLLRRKSSLVSAYLCFIFFPTPTRSGVIELTDSNYNETIANSELVLVNFYSQWCGYSTQFAPVYEAAADKVDEIFPIESKIVLGRIDGDNHERIMNIHKVVKFPTVKLVRFGFVFHNEYRGSRTVEGIIEFVKQQLENPTQVFDDLDEIINNDDEKKMIVGYFSSNTSQSYNTFVQLAQSLRDDCSFYAGFGETSRAMRHADTDVVVFRPDKTTPLELDEKYNGTYEKFPSLIKWAYPKCFSIVREITFENAEAITEEGIPLLILFYHPNNKQIIPTFNQVIEEMVGNDTDAYLQSVNFVTADGTAFSHPLEKLGKSIENLPLLAADSFTHMYLYPESKDILDKEAIKEFIGDLNSGKLHREFHNGPDSTPAPAATHEEEASEENEILSPPESTFIKLAPSEKRYTILRDEF